MRFTIKNRLSLIVYVDSQRQARFLKRYGDLKYVSKRFHYAILYVDSKRANQIKNRLKRLNFVDRIDDSPIASLSKELADKTIAVAVDDQENQ